MATKAAFLSLVWLIRLSNKKGEVTGWTVCQKNREVPSGMVWFYQPAHGELKNSLLCAL